MPEPPQPPLNPEVPRNPESVDLSPPQPLERERVLLPVILLLITCVTTTLAGFFLVNSIGGGVTGVRDLVREPALLAQGLPFSATLLTILLAHEMGHYLACRYYGIRATLPYVIPGPPIPFGTFGAIIRVKSPFGNGRQLFDVGVAGPLAGMVFVVPAAVLGLAWSVPQSGELPSQPGYAIGFPLLFKAIVAWLHGAGRMETVHPLACAAWFGCLATSFNLIPIGQLDGGHITRSVLGPRVHYQLSRLAWLTLIAAGFFWWPGYLVFGIVLLFLGFRHPPPLRSQSPLGRCRLLLALTAALVFIVTTIPVPIRLVDDLSAW